MRERVVDVTIEVEGWDVQSKSVVDLERVGIRAGT
jgi:hypothetical protein